MDTVHAAQPYSYKIDIPLCCRAWVCNVSSEYHSMCACDYVRIHRLAFKNKLNYKWTSIHQIFSCQTSYNPYSPNIFTAQVFTIWHIAQASSSLDASMSITPHPP